jgi:hypothetical protein
LKPEGLPKSGFTPFSDWNGASPGHNSQNSFYGQNDFITDITDDMLAGTFEGNLHSPSGNTINGTEGEFKIKLFRKYMPCGNRSILFFIIKRFLIMPWHDKE